VRALRQTPTLEECGCDIRGLTSDGTGLTYNGLFMTAYVYVSLKKSVLDPQGKTIQGALKKMGYKGLESVRQGKYFELTLDGGLSRDEAQAEVERIAREVLTNPVIEEFRYSLAE
jgi:phosphoribosylformylglycinamidine synthase PurS subunit